MSPEPSLELLVLHALHLRGMAETEAVAEYLESAEQQVEDELESLVERDAVERRFGRLGGWRLTAGGRLHHRQLLEEELDDHEVRTRIERLYEQFLPINTRLLAVCTDWQLRPSDNGLEPNDHTDAAYDAAVVERLAEADNDVHNLLAELCDVATRFSMHSRRLKFALDRVQAGDHDYFVTPMFPSYHTTWFELHEDLLVTLGRSRRNEGAG